MMKLGIKKKVVIIKKKRFILVISVFITLLCLIFYIGSKVSAKKQVVKNVNTTKVTLPQPRTDVNMNAREGKSINKELNSDSSSTNVYNSDGHKIAYLTFDDGPCDKTTPGILKVLDSYNIKATFFIVGSYAIKYPDLVKKEAMDGQAIGNHTYSHNYNYLYSNTNTFLSDVNKCDTTLKSILGSDFNGKLVRFPGGSFGKKLEPFRVALKSDGYHYIDWNDLTGDAEGQNIPVDKLLANLKKNTEGKGHVVILMHDLSTKATTVQALPKVIDYLKSKGYSFKTLS
ncbi:polysaccharide deacetylase family protein [Clostridium estertheticum]|uniref:polysaccharide deacetylase family protein n=1 Tax=Clostridium estertheticum TaxID=238834 RepID=UPI001CF36AA2|nr:polysaccharide deacetylase family protein [Clostridium estertheticum]MCB2355145.1 polysaccharide deacetylase [Clostridium estertheticum]WAG39438.1 polysaccharide deacetylase [Clostridium estertheticum]